MDTYYDFTKFSVKQEGGKKVVEIYSIFFYKKKLDSFACLFPFPIYFLSFHFVYKNCQKSILRSQKVLKSTEIFWNHSRSPYVAASQNNLPIIP